MSEVALIRPSLETRSSRARRVGSSVAADTCFRRLDYTRPCLREPRPTAGLFLRLVRRPAPLVVLDPAVLARRPAPEALPPVPRRADDRGRLPAVRARHRAGVDPPLAAPPDGVPDDQVAADRERQHYQADDR